MKRRTFLQFAMTLLAGCAASPTRISSAPASADTPPGGGNPTPAPTRFVPAGDPATCHPVPLVAPTRPAGSPSVDELDANGLHVTNAARAVVLDPQEYRLRVSGALERPLNLSLEDLRCMPQVTATVNLTCKGYFEDVSTYSGVPLIYLFDLAGLNKTANTFTFSCADGYQAFLKREEVLDAHNFLAYQWKEEPVPIFHGFPVRAVLPARLGYAWTKFLVEIQVD